ncbi:pseudouridine synthase [Sphingobacterium paludis]|uniref:Pseudouridine synthase n=1 Tax=Sphingobacterium paludis TaxID=1476465 RepID=A0A4R7D9V2_9SPHI|nr:pseudouridine synthase [Sphingobacterium paludis]TDS17142.1 23S rRNA pseudouridine2605 synthase [Sphingobacterium paludis]
MPFNSKRNSRDDNSKKGRSDERSFGSKSGRNQQSSSKSGSGKPGFERTDRKQSDKPFNKFEKREKRDDERSYKKFDKGERNSADRPFNKFEKKDSGRSYDKFDKGGRSDGTRSFNKFEKDDRRRSDRPFNKFEKDDRRGNDRPFNSFEKKDRRNDDDKGDRYPTRDNRDRKFSGDNRSFDKSKRPFKRFDDTEGNSDVKTFHPRKKIASAEPKDDGLIRLNRYISNAGICSRRKADELITSGVVSVNGEVVTELGTKVDPATDEIRYNNERLKREKMVYVLLNKPKDYITTTDDPQERRTVMHLVAKATKERIYPVGRLDRNTTGLLLLTNDGNLAEKLSHPRNNISKIYNVELSKNLTQGDFNKIQFGIELEDGLIKPDDLSYVQGGSKREVGIQIHSGKNRIVRRIFESLGYEVVKLDRVVYANLTKKDLTRGRWRYLEERELVQLKHLMK